jgi:putative aldouronate transport system permease protein
LSSAFRDYPPLIRKSSRFAELRRDLSRHSSSFLLLAPALILVFIFSYVPMYGVVIAFKDYRIMKGILGSSWVGLAQFRKLFLSPSFLEVLNNTIVISFYRLVFGFPAPIVLALLLNEIRATRFKKTVQTISYLPHFMSWIVISGILIEILSPQRGVVNQIIRAFGGKPIYFLAEADWFRAVLIVSGIWQGVGWGSVIYLAAIAAIDQELYEAARIDGANRLQQALLVTLPLLTPVMAVLLILSIGSILNAGFDQIFNLYSAMVYRVADILDTYIYRRGLIETDYSFATAAGLFKNVIGFFLVIGANIFSKRVSEYGVW